MSDSVMNEVDRSALELAKAALWKHAWNRQAEYAYGRHAIRAKRHSNAADRRFKRAVARYRLAEWAAMIEATA